MKITAYGIMNTPRDKKKWIVGKSIRRRDETIFKAVPDKRWFRFKTSVDHLGYPRKVWEISRVCQGRQATWERGGQTVFKYIGHQHNAEDRIQS